MVVRQLVQLMTVEAAKPYNATPMSSLVPILVHDFTS